MASFLNTTYAVEVITTLPPSITKPQVLTLLHDRISMLDLNPLLKSHTLLPPPASTNFYATVPAEHKDFTAAEIEALPIYKVVEGTGPEEQEGSSWRGGWAKRIIPGEIVYDTSMQLRDDGMITLTHAPMGVGTVTTWTVKEEGGKLILGLKGVVSANRMLMGFIRTTLQGSYDKLAVDFVTELEKRAKGEGVANNGAAVGGV
ncbi:hypothetical protein HYFRA_00011903 [Hymenoscyphus fraxineus]|uniref:DUF7053 domain-containing protein n=1 Tax=Hymenoscyphus fraxineus TaxID=746836 RepID=A0A9N9L3Z3_9HELO|nr:hypothetical protein HYFRA_00011903 [Hymenoscyphus fraxineus]